MSYAVIYNKFCFVDEIFFKKYDSQNVKTDVTIVQATDSTAG